MKWKVTRGGHGLPAIWDEENKTCVSDRVFNGHETLIAAAPTMLAALQHLAEWLPRYIELYGDNGLRLSDFVGRVREALAAAEKQ